MPRILLMIAYILVGTGALAWCKHECIIDWAWLSILAPLWLSGLALILGGAAIALVLSIGRLFEMLDQRFPLDAQTKDKDACD